MTHHMRISGIQDDVVGYEVSVSSALRPALHDSAPLGLAVYGLDWGPCQPAGEHCSVFSRPEQLSLRISH